jgi:glycine/D-amino acid oxidase-like deaminating enzyme
MPHSAAKKPRVVVCGAGVIGASIAYFLSLKNAEVIVVERSGVANAASGKSAGFLAYDWCRGTAVDALAKRSFALHAELAATLAAELGLDWGYRRLDTLSVAASERRDVSSIARMKSPSWLGTTTAVHSQIGTEQTTAQLNPAQFTRGMLTAAEAKGAELVSGTVEGLVMSSDSRRATGALVDGEALDADAVVIAMGPWSILACRWLPLPAIYGLKGHSVVFRYEPPEPHALFVELETESGQVETPEVMPRPDGTTYMCGLSEEAPLPVDPSHVTSEPDASERLRAMATAFAPDLGNSEILTSQACYRPVTVDSVPLIGRVPGVDGAFVATGHNVWGMLNGPATGEAMAELIVDGAATTVHLTPFDPGRLKPLDPSAIHDQDE